MLRMWSRCMRPIVCMRHGSAHGRRVRRYSPVRVAILSCIGLTAGAGVPESTKAANTPTIA